MSQSFDYILLPISLTIIGMAVVFSIGLSITAYKSYKNSKQFESLLFVIIFIFMASAMAFLALTKILVTINIPLTVHFINNMATISSVVAVICLNMFAFKTLTEERYKGLTIIVIIILSITLAFLMFDPMKTVHGEEIVYDPWPGLTFSVTDLLTYFTILPFMILPIFVFNYFSIKTRKISKTQSKKSFLIALGILVLTVAFILELTLDNLLLTTIARIGFPISTIILYFGIFRMKAD